jgi:hypothetical protein
MLVRTTRICNHVLVVRLYKTQQKVNELKPYDGLLVVHTNNSIASIKGALTTTNFIRREHVLEFIEVLQSHGVRKVLTPIRIDTHSDLAGLIKYINMKLYADR